MIETNDALSVTISGNRIVNVSGNNLIDVSESSVSSYVWDCEFDEYENFLSYIAIDNLFLYVEISQSGYMKIYIDNIKLPELDDRFLSKIQHLFYPFGVMKKTLWKGHILPKGAKFLEGTLKLYYNPEESRISVRFSYFEQIDILKPNLGVSMDNMHIFIKSIDIDLRRFGL